MAKELTSKKTDYAKWYNDLVIKADLAENSAVRGCMVIKPYGYAIWEALQADLDRRFKETGHQNVYFPLFIPKSFFSKEASHVEGFAKECAVITHYRLKNDENGKGVIVDPEAKLDEELIVRPTSETIIWDTYKRWIQSYRDLPLLYNQWANVVRWELRTRLFLRTSEFLWQEGHTAHATKEEAEVEALKMMNVYADFVEEFMGISVIRGIKTESERFAGAENTYCIEGIMQDGKALQMGTSHFLGQNFAKAFDVKYLNKEGKHEYVWATSWGVSTRLVGGMIMNQSDDFGLVLTPSLAPIQVVIIPIYRKDEEKKMVIDYSDKLFGQLKEKKVRVKLDDNENQKPGWKFNEYELKGVPIRIVVGLRDLVENKVEIFVRENMKKEIVSIENIDSYILELLPKIQADLFEKSKKHQKDSTVSVSNYEELKEILKIKNGVIYANWDGTKESENKLKKETQATIRCIPLEGSEPDGPCVITGNKSKYKVYIAKAY